MRVCMHAHTHTQYRLSKRVEVGDSSQTCNNLSHLLTLAYSPPEAPLPIFYLSAEYGHGIQHDGEELDLEPESWFCPFLAV